MVGDAETFGERQGRCEPLDCFAHVGVVQDRYYGRVWCRSVLLQHGFRRYQCFPSRLTRHKRSATAGEGACRCWWKVEVMESGDAERPAVRSIIWLDPFSQQCTQCLDRKSTRLNSSHITISY